MSAPPKTTAQLRRIYGTAKEVGLDADMLHLLVMSVVGVSSLKDLSFHQANTVIAELVKYKTGVTKQKRQRKQLLGKETPGITPNQARYLKRLREALEWTEDRLNGFVKRQTRVERWELLTRYQAVGVIQAIKEMAERKQE